MYLYICENTRVLRIFVTVRTSGGAIRDVLIGLTPTDVDLATNAPPHLVESIVSASPGLAFGKAPKRSRNFGSYKVNYSISYTVFLLSSFDLL